MWRFWISFLSSNSPGNIIQSSVICNVSNVSNFIGKSNKPKAHEDTISILHNDR